MAGEVRVFSRLLVKVQREGLVLPSRQGEGAQGSWCQLCVCRREVQSTCNSAGTFGECMTIQSNHNLVTKTNLKINRIDVGQAN
jgi:hypothetical protein